MIMLKSQTLTFRAAIPSDSESVAELIESAYRGPGSRTGWTTEADLLDGQRTDADAVLTALHHEGCGCWWQRRRTER
jgi:hypothetical protein